MRNKTFGRRSMPSAGQSGETQCERNGGEEAFHTSAVDKNSFAKQRRRGSPSIHSCRHDAVAPKII